MEYKATITVIGPGAMGGLFGALFARAGHDVQLLGLRPEQAEAINARGLGIERDGRMQWTPVPACVETGRCRAADLVLVSVKSGQTQAAARSAVGIVAQGGAVLTLQNGMGNAEKLAEAIDGRAVVLAGTTAQGATVLKDGQVRHAGTGPTVIGPWSDSGRDWAERAVEMFNRAGIPAELTDDPRPALWGKLIVNVGINAITALTGIRNGEILDMEATRELSRAAVLEAVATAVAAGVPVREDAARHVFQVAEATGANRSSMGQDVDRQRPTEIGAINGVVVEEGRKRGVKTPVNETLTALVRTLENHYRGR